MTSAAEAEIGASFINSQDKVSENTTLNEMGHPQPQTRIQVDSTTANVFVRKTLKQKWSKYNKIRFYWMQDRCAQQKFKILEIRINKPL